MGNPCPGLHTKVTKLEKMKGEDPIDWRDIL
jgi:hypothetical protein